MWLLRFFSLLRAFWFRNIPVNINGKGKVISVSDAEFDVLGFFWSWNRCVYPKTWNCTACPPKCSTMNLGCSRSYNCSCVCRYPFHETNRGYCVSKFSEVCATEASLGVILNSTMNAVNSTALNRTNAFG